MDKSFNRGMFNKFESRKVCVAGYHCDNSDFDFCITEHNELPVIKICSDEGRDDGCRQNVDPPFWTPLLDPFLDPLLDPFLDPSFFKEKNK